MDNASLEIGGLGRRRRKIMIVSKIDGQLFQDARRRGLPGRSSPRPRPGNQERSFESYLMEAFQGEVVGRDGHFSAKLSPLTHDNLTRLGQSI